MKATDQPSARSTVEALASQYHITGERDRYSALATTITQLSGDEIELDPVERMIIALNKQGVLSKREALQLELRYLREQSEAASRENPANDIRSVQ